MGVFLVNGVEALQSGHSSLKSIFSYKKVPFTCPRSEVFLYNADKPDTEIHSYGSRL